MTTTNLTLTPGEIWKLWLPFIVAAVVGFVAGMFFEYSVQRQGYEEAACAYWLSTARTEVDTLRVYLEDPWSADLRSDQ